jgi:hypothetical protein
MPLLNHTLEQPVMGEIFDHKADTHAVAVGAVGEEAKH